MSAYWDAWFSCSMLRIMNSKFDQIETGPWNGLILLCSGRDWCHWKADDLSSPMTPVPSRTEQYNISQFHDHILIRSFVESRLQIWSLLLRSLAFSPDYCAAQPGGGSQYSGVQCYGLKCGSCIERHFGCAICSMKNKNLKSKYGHESTLYYTVEDEPGAVEELRSSAL